MIHLCYNSLKKWKIFYSVSLRLMWAHAWMLWIRCFEGVMMVQARSRYDSHAAVLRFAILSLTECWRAPRTCTHSWQPSSPESVLTSMRKPTLFRWLMSNGRIGLEKLVPNFSFQSWDWQNILSSDLHFRTHQWNSETVRKPHCLDGSNVCNVDQCETLYSKYRL